MADLEIKRGESRTLKFTFNSTITEANINGAVFTFKVKTNIDNDDSLVTIEHAEFDLSDAANKIITCVFDSDDSDMVGNFVCELEAIFSGTTTFKSATRTLSVYEAINR